MEEIIKLGIVVLISIIINFLSFYYLIDKHKSDKKIKNEFTKAKSLTSYSLAILSLVIITVIGYLINISALDVSNINLMIALSSVAYLIVIVFSYVYSNITVEYTKYLIRNGEKGKEIFVFIIHNIITLTLSYASIYTFVLLMDYKIISILRMIMLLSIVLSFMIVMLYKEIKEFIKVKKQANK